MGRALLIWSAVLCLAGTALARDRPFQREMRTKGIQYGGDLKAAEDLVLAGDVETAVRRLVELTEVDRTVAMDMIVGEVLYNLDRGASYRLHKRAFETRPGEATVTLAWALERHRKGEYADAIPLYERYARQMARDEVKPQPAADPRVNALLADCLVREGRLMDAVAAWRAADVAQNHADIDQAIHEVYGDPSPFKTRGDLMHALNEGQPGRAEMLIDLDLNMAEDWWHAAPNREALQRDLPVVERVLESGSRRFRAVQCWVAVASLPPHSAALVRDQLHKAQLIVDDGPLPESSLVAGRLISAALDCGLQTRGPLRARFGDKLLKRAKSEAGDVEALNTLCDLSLDDLDKLAELDRYGWERYGDARFAVSLLAVLAAEGRLKLDSPEFAQALAKFPDNALVQKLALRCAGPEKATPAMVVAAIEAEFHHLSPGVTGGPDCSTLNAYFAGLAKKGRKEEGTEGLRD